MIFVTIGTHPESFERLIRRIDEIAPKVKEKIIVQRGFTKYLPKNCESFEFTDKISEYYKKADLVIVQSATSLIEFSLKYKKPVITVPRQSKFKEHLNDHQVEFGQFFSKKTGIKCILDINELTPELLNNYDKRALIDKNNLIKLQNYFKDTLNDLAGFNLPKPFAKNRNDYIINLINPQKNEKILNIGISNIPEIEMSIENKVRECWTIDIDKKKINDASHYLNKTKIIEEDITKTNKLKDNYFDKVVIIEVLEHIKDDIEIIKKIRKVLKPKGEIIVGVPNNAFLHYFNPVKYFEHERHYSNNLIKERLEKNGFKIVHFNLVETWTLLINLYIHIFLKFILRKQVPFGIFKKRANKSYMQLNKGGMDILLKGVKI